MIKIIRDKYYKEIIRRLEEKEKRIRLLNSYIEELEKTINEKDITINELTRDKIELETRLETKERVNYLLTREIKRSKKKEV